MRPLVSGKAFLALWNSVAPGMLDAYEAWHSSDHVPERLTVPGMIACHRYRDATGAPAFFTLYDVESLAVFAHPAYGRLLARPSPSSAAMRPHLIDLRRSTCEVVVAADRPAPVALRLAEGGRAAGAILVGRPRPVGPRHPVEVDGFRPKRLVVFDATARPAAAPSAASYRLIESLVADGRESLGLRR